MGLRNRYVVPLILIVVKMIILDKEKTKWLMRRMTSTALRAMVNPSSWGLSGCAVCRRQFPNNELFILGTSNEKWISFCLNCAFIHKISTILLIWFLKHFRGW